MQNNILIIGGKGLVGSTIHRILKDRNPHYTIVVGTRSATKHTTEIEIDVNVPSSLTTILAHHIDLIILSVNDSDNNVLRFALAQGIDYLDITKPTPALNTALQVSNAFTDYKSRIVFGSGWMGGIVPGLVKSVALPSQTIDSVNVMVYYSIKDKAGYSSAHFMAEHVATPFVRYENNIPVAIKHFLDSETYCFSFGLHNRQVYNFDTPDLYILNTVEHIPTVSVKMTYNAKLATKLLGWMQQYGIFKRLSLSTRRKVFGGSGDGDISVFEISIKTANTTKRVFVKSAKGQAELTALSTVLHTEALFGKQIRPGQYFAHELYSGQELAQQLKEYETITLTEV